MNGMNGEDKVAMSKKAVTPEFAKMIAEMGLADKAATAQDPRIETQMELFNAMKKANTELASSAHKTSKSEYGTQFKTLTINGRPFWLKVVKVSVGVGRQDEYQIKCDKTKRSEAITNAQGALQAVVEYGFENHDDQDEGDESFAETLANHIRDAETFLQICQDKKEMYKQGMVDRREKGQALMNGPGANGHMTR